MTRPAWSEEAIRALGTRTTVPVAGEIIAGLGPDESYRSVKRGTFPVPVLRVGRHLVVPVAPILEFLRLSGAGETQDVQAVPIPLRAAGPRHAGGPGDRRAGGGDAT